MFVLCFVIAYTVDLLVPWSIGYILGVFVKSGFTEAAFQQSLYGVAAYVGLRMINTFFHHLGRYIQNTVAFTARMHALTEIFEAFISFPLRWHVNHHSGENLSKLHRSVGAIESTIGTYVWQIVEGVVKVVFASVAIFALDFWVAVDVLTMSIVTMVTMILFNAKLTSRIRRNNAFNDRLNRTCVDYLFNIVTVKTLKLEGPALDYLEHHKTDGLALSQKISKYSELKWGSVGTGYGLVLGSSLIIYFYHHKGFSGPFDVAQVYVLMNYLDRIFQALGSFTGYYGGLVEASTAYEDAETILKEAQTVRNLSPLHQLDNNWQKLYLKDLEFNYITGEYAGLRGLSVEIKRGEKIALVGPSGGGKSTLLKIMAGMLIPQKCSVSTDVQNDVSIDAIAQRSLLLPQEPEIFSETVRFNLSMGEKFKPEELHFFISLCKVESILAKLPLGWDTSLAEKGLNLSVGEKQRIAMCRGLLRAAGKELILLDEPTSSLDPMTEKEIFFGLLYHFTDRTVITACHRLVLVPLFDKIVYISHGKIDEVGSFSELMAKEGLFYQAWKDYEKKIVKE